MGVHPSVTESFEIREKQRNIQKMDDCALINDARRECTHVVLKATCIKRVDHRCSI